MSFHSSKTQLIDTCLNARIYSWTGRKKESRNVANKLVQIAILALSAELTNVSITKSMYYSDTNTVFKLSEIDSTYLDEIDQISLTGHLPNNWLH